MFVDDTDMVPDSEKFYKKRKLKVTVGKNKVKWVNS